MMREKNSGHLIQLLNEEIVPFSPENESALNALIEKIGDARRIVLMGEATHGSAEFYKARIELSKKLIAEKKFHAIAIEGDWTSAYSVHRYLYGHGKPEHARLSLSDFNRFPAWMWRNSTLPPFLKWLRTHNEQFQQNREKVGFYGMDLYCLYSSIEAVIDYLKINHPDLAKKALERYACFDHHNADPQTYGYMVNANLKKSCMTEVTNQLLEMQFKAFGKIHADHWEEEELLFYTLQNARLIKNAEHYYRAMFESHEESWNIRDRHMTETIQNLVSYLETKLNVPAKIIIWAHNSHVGDARATEMSQRREINLGQLIREQFSNTSFHLGFSTYTGTVTAADNWDSDARFKSILPALEGSYESLFHSLNLNAFMLFLHDNEELTHLLQISRLQRAIGVIYRPDTERDSHYFFSRLPFQFDALIHIDKTSAAEPLEGADDDGTIPAS